jgi:hypothetical protein
MTDPGDLQAAVEAGVIDGATRDRLAAFLQARKTPSAAIAASPQPRFDLTHVLWYGGALIVMAAMGLFSTLAFSERGGYALAAIAAVYAVGFWALGRYLWRVKDLVVPGGLAIAVAVSMAPVAIYGLQEAVGLWAHQRPALYWDFFPPLDGDWLLMEIGAILASALALRFYPFPFLLLIAGVALWFMSMDLVRWLARSTDADDWELRRKVSIVFGLVMIAVAWALDLRGTRSGDFGFWLHLVGALTLWGALTTSEGGGPIGHALYGAINIVLVFFGVFLNRRIYAALGALGVAGYLGYLAYDVFKDVVLFSFALSAIGLAVIFVGVMVQKNRRAIAAGVERATPRALDALRPKRARLD